MTQVALPTKFLQHGIRDIPVIGYVLEGIPVQVEITEGTVGGVLKHACATSMALRSWESKFACNMTRASNAR